MSTETPMPYTAFLCHSSGDKQQVREFYRRLLNDNVTCWFDEEDLLPGQDWDYQIRQALRKSRYVLACLSRSSISKAGYVQKELKRALDLADEQPDDSIYLIPVRLESCEVPDRLRRWHWVDLFEQRGYERLLRVLRSGQTEPTDEAVSQIVQPQPPVADPDRNASAPEAVAPVQDDPNAHNHSEQAAARPRTSTPAGRASAPPTTSPSSSSSSTLDLRATVILSKTVLTFTEPEGAARFELAHASTSDFTNPRSIAVDWIRLPGGSDTQCVAVIDTTGPWFRLRATYHGSNQPSAWSVAVRASESAPTPLNRRSFTDPVTETCAFCAGSGECAGCGGRGRSLTRDGPTPCTSCQGAKLCFFCEGEGSVRQFQIQPQNEPLPDESIMPDQADPGSEQERPDRSESDWREGSPASEAVLLHLAEELERTRRPVSGDAAGRRRRGRR